MERGKGGERGLFGFAIGFGGGKKKMVFCFSLLQAVTVWGGGRREKRSNPFDYGPMGGGKRRRRLSANEIRSESYSLTESL